MTAPAVDVRVLDSGSVFLFLPLAPDARERAEESVSSGGQRLDSADRVRPSSR